MFDSFNHENKLRKSILEFGGNLEYNESSNEYPSQTNETSDSFEMEREKTLATFSLFKEIKSIDDQQFEKIRPGFSAKRDLYMFHYLVILIPIIIFHKKRLFIKLDKTLEARAI